MTQYSTLAAVCDERHTDSATFSRMTTRTVYVELLGEGVGVWRPVKAIEDGEAFVLPPTSPEGERCRFGLAVAFAASYRTGKHSSPPRSPPEPAVVA